MKLFSLLGAAFFSLATLAPTTASAGHECGGERTRVTYDRCGNPVFWSYTFVGRDHCGRPVFQWIQQSRGGYSGYDRGGYDRGGYSGYDRGGYGRGGYSGYDRGGRDFGRGRGNSCDRGRGRSGVSFYFGH